MAHPVAVHGKAREDELAEGATALQTEHAAPGLTGAKLQLGRRVGTRLLRVLDRQTQRASGAILELTERRAAVVAVVVAFITVLHLHSRVVTTNRLARLARHRAFVSWNRLALLAALSRRIALLRDVKLAIAALRGGNE